MEYKSGLSSNKVLLLVLLIIGHLSTGQSCLQKMDSADYYSVSNREKAKFFATSLLTDLDSGKCNVEIGFASLYNNVGLLLWELNNKSHGIKALLSGLTHELINKDSIDHELLGLYYNLSAIYIEIGSFQEASKYINLARRVVSGFYAEDQLVQLEFLFIEGVYYRDIGQFNKSLESFDSAIKLVGTSNDSIRISLQIELGTTFRSAGDLEKSEMELLAAAEFAKNRNELQYLRAIDRLSSLKIEQGEYSDSENYLLHNLQVKQEQYGDEPLLVLETLSGLGILYYKLNDLVSANTYLSEALDKSTNLHTIKPYMLNNMGTVYMKQGDLKKAEDCFLESAEGFKALFGSMNPDYASSLNNLAGIYKKQGKLSEALNLYTKVLDMDKVIYGSNHARYATSLNNVALLYLQLGHVSLAGKLLKEAKAIRGATLGNYHPLYIKSMNDLAVYYLVNNEPEEAMNQFNEALAAEIKHMQEVFPVLTDKQRKLYFDDTRYNVERFCSLAFQEKYINSPYAMDALNHFINTKGILFYASEKMRQLIQGSSDSQTKKTYNDWREKKYKLAQSYLLTEDERARQGISTDNLEQECSNLEKELSRKFKVFSDQEKSAYHTWEDISAVLPDSTAMVDIIQFREYKVSIKENDIIQGFTDQSKYAAFVIKPNGVLESATWPKDKDFEKGFSSYRNSLQFGLKDITSYGNFWEPIDNHLNDINKLFLSPDGIFHKLNPAVFFDTKHSAYLIDRYDILNVTSGKDLLYHQQKSLTRNAIIFGNPDFSNLNISTKLNQLPGAEQEAQDITNILNVRKWESKSYYFAQATENQIKTMSNPGVVHIATHGYFNDDPDLVDPLHSSGLFLSRQPESQDDGLLSAYEAMNLLLDQTSIVVLAACETGLGTIKNGEGVFGLQRAFLVAGAENVLISLVKINDQAARTFMGLFYQHLIKEENPQNAFFKARREFKQADNNPLNWGAYILVSKG